MIELIQFMRKRVCSFINRKSGSWIAKFKLAMLGLSALILLSTACEQVVTIPTDSRISPDPTASLMPLLPTATLTPAPPSPSPIPLAARVNGEPISLADFQAELDRFQTTQQESGTNLATNPEQVVLDEMINQVLLAQAARQSGFTVDDAMLQSREEALVLQLGGRQVLEDWIAKHGYTPESFRQSLAQAIEAAWIRDQIAAGVPQVTEQVHVRQILLYNEEQAQQVYTLLQSGQEFNSLAANYDPVLAGDLGWFPRGYLTESRIEEAAFALEPGEYTAVIETTLGYHILYLIEKDPQRPLDPDALLTLQIQAVENWLKARRSQSTIEILLPGS